MDDNILEMDSDNEDFDDSKLGMIHEEVVYPEEFLPTYYAIKPEVSANKTNLVDYNNQTDSLFFNDGVRSVDFILVYEDEETKPLDKNYTFKRRKKRREYFESCLMQMGLELEATQSVHKDNLVYVKVHVPWEVQCTYAEVLHIKIPIAVNDHSVQYSIGNLFDWITKHFKPNEKLIKKEADCYTAPYQKERHECFLKMDKEKYFTPSMRSRMANFILCRAPYEIRGTVKKFGITKLLRSGVYKAAYPLHDCRFNVKSTVESCPNERYLLYKEWAHPKNFYKTQPLDLIRKYYGEKIGIYFAWLGFYTKMLAFASVVGLACFFYGYHIQEKSTWSKEVCDPDIGGKIVMCPQCDLCNYWILNSTCDTSKTLTIFDHFGTLVFAVFMAVWVTVFLEFWKRYQSQLEFEWDTVEFLEQQEPSRPEYDAECVHDRINSVTGVKEKVPFKFCGRCFRLSIGIGTVLFWIMLIVVSVVAIIIYRLAVFFSLSIKLKNPGNFTTLEPLKDYVTPQMATSVTAGLINFVVIMILNTLYERVAIWITDYEIPRTRTDYENSLTLKMFLFQFVNYYSSCFYVAFFKGKFVGYPGKYAYMFGSTLRNEECDPGGCLIELTTQLVIVMTGKQVWGNIQEALLPWVMNWWGSRKARSHPESLYSRWEQDHDLQSFGQLGLFYEYLEMVIQFGFITLFVASFPLAPLLALFNNIIEIRVDAWKLTTQFRRPVAAKAHSIGAWEEILNGMAVLSVVTNAFIVAFTSDMMPRLVYMYAYQPQGQMNMKGYINNSLSVFNVYEFQNSSRPEEAENPMWLNITTCRYRDYRYPPGHEKQYFHTMQFWHILAAKLAFIIIMEHVVFLVKYFVAWLIPDVPSDVRARVKRERFLVHEYLHNYEVNELKRQLGQQGDKECTCTPMIYPTLPKHEVLSEVL